MCRQAVRIELEQWTRKEDVMKKSSMLVLLGKSAQPADVARLVDRARLDKLYLSVLVIGEAPTFPYYADGLGQFGGAPMATAWQQDFERETLELGKTATSIKEYLAIQEVDCGVSVICAEPVVIAEAIARAALVCDLVVVSNDLRGNASLFNATVQAALFKAPAGVLVNATASPAALAPKRVMVAWRPAKACARAVHAAMPMLRGAEEVTIVVIDPVMTPMRDGEDPGSDVAHWLSHQGCKVTVRQSPSGGHDVGHILIKHAREAGADLIVMGAYDHSRLREIVFGGTTRTLVEQEGLAVLMAH
jgi:nucleotide-binding universal stress UspA family protein